MSTTLTIHITKEVINDSRLCTMVGSFTKHKIGQNCAIGRAINHIFPHSWTAWDGIIIGSSKVRFKNTKLDSEWYYKSVIVPLPFSAQKFISLFDRATPDERVEMQPFSFDIEVPDEVINQINIDEVLKLANTVTRKEVCY